MAKSLHKEQNLELKYKALLELEKVKTNKEVAQLFGVPVMESLKDVLEMKKKIFHENYGITAEELEDIDFEVSVTSTSSDANIIAEVSGHVDINDEEESDDEEQPTDCMLSLKDTMNATTVLEDYSLFSNFRADLMKALKDVNCAFDLDCLSNKNQSTIKDFVQTL